MSEYPSTETSPQIIVIADVESNAQAIVERILKPSGFHAWVQSEQAPNPDVLVVDVTQLRGDPLASLRNYRSNGEDSPAILLAAHFPLSRLRELFRLGVNDFLLKPYRPSELCQAITDLSETHSAQADSEILTSRMDRLREQLRRRTDEIRMLSEIGRAVVSMDDLNEILRSVVEAAAFVTDAEEASIYLADPESKELVLRASKEAGERHASLQKLRVSDTIVGEVFHSGQPILRQPSMEGGPVKVQTGFLVQSIVNVPLRMRNKIVGVLGVYNRLAPRTFTEHHLTLMMALADWAGVALEQATLKRSAKTEPLTPQPSSSATTPEYSQGVNLALETLDGILKSDPENTEVIQKTLGELMAQLRGLDAMPVVNLDAEQSSEMVNISGLVDKTVESMKNAAQAKGLDLISERGKNIPLFRGDPEKVQQVLKATVAAAIRRTVRGRVILETHHFEILRSQSEEFPLTVNVDMHDGAWAAVRVSDSSPGLSPDTVQAITSQTINPGSGQMGPGLSMGEIRMIVESMNGVMWYEHTPASTSITFALPIL
ncbi:MAG: GAF domain-containing protein [Anaerolineales bacterium]|nr:GAF domain-containing protein [Anaerolineales bacterium]